MLGNSALSRSYPLTAGYLLFENTNIIHFRTDVNVKHVFFHNGKPYSFAQLSKHWRRNKADLMPVLGQTAVNFFRSRFRAQAWTDKFAKKWQKRAVDLHTEKYSPKQRRQSKGRAILVKSSQLLKSIHMKNYSSNQVVISAPKKYAAIHNEGFDGNVHVKQHTRRVQGRTVAYSLKTRRKQTKRYVKGITTVKAHTRRMKIPQRQFMGNSHNLNRRFERIIVKDIDKTLKP